MKVKVALLAAVVILSLVMAAGPSGAARAVFRAKGSPGSFRWEPTRRVIQKGDKIVWRNRTDYNHTVTAYSKNSKSWNKDTTVRPGEATRKRFKRKGRFRFRCTIPGHSSLANDGTCSGMCGVVRVKK